MFSDYFEALGWAIRFSLIGSAEWVFKSVQPK